MNLRHKILLRDGFTLGGRLDRTLSDRDLAPAIGPEDRDAHWMEQALLAAMEAVGWSAPNPSVGAVIVDRKSNLEIARGFTQRYRHEHAERIAIERARAYPDFNRSDRDWTVYSTLEPCSHQGNQPPCADLLIASRIKRVVIGSGDPDRHVAGQGIARLKDAGIEITTGVLEAECQAWHFPFLRTRFGHKKIVWIGKWAQTLDGDLADANGDSKWISGPKSRAYTHWLRQKYDAILVSADTYLRDQPQLTVRDCALPHRRNPLKFILDRRGQLLPGQVDPSFRVVRTLDEIESIDSDPPLQSVLVEGGPTLLNALIQEGRLDAVHQFISPKQFNYPEGSDPTRFRVRWSPGPGWYCAAHQKIDDDVLREWVKSF